MSTQRPTIAAFPSARAALSFAERHARAEDDVPPEELQFFTAFYAEISREARHELAQRAGVEVASDAPTALREHADQDSRTALLRHRYEACRLVRESERLRARRTLPLQKWAWPLVAVIALLLFFTGDRLLEALELGDVSRGKAWVASSTYSPDQALSGTLTHFEGPFFFHTTYQIEPWIEVDLGQPRLVHSAIIKNRRDCCGTRSVPLVLETRRDRGTWREVARMDHAFEVWRPRFWAWKTRFLRLRVPRAAVLHLKAIAFH